MSKLKSNSLKSLYQFYYGHILEPFGLDEVSLQRTIKQVDERRVVSGFPLFSNGTITLLLSQVELASKAKVVEHE
jgi:hypothetical protein